MTDQISAPIGVDTPPSWVCVVCDEPIPGDHYAGEDARVGSIEDLDPMAVER